MPVRSPSKTCHSVSDPNLSDLMVRQFFALNLRVQSEKTRRQYRFALADLEQLLGRPATIADLSDEVITRLVVHLRDVRNLHPRTCNDRRGRLNCLWRWLADKGFTTRRPTNVALPVPERSPDAWPREQLEQLMRACANANGSVGELPASVFWLAFHAVQWDTGARTGEMLDLRWEWLDWNTGWLRVPADARKGRRKPATYRLMPDTLGLLASFRKSSGLILGFELVPSRFYQLYKRLLIDAGLPSDRYSKPQKIRRSHASWLAAAGGNATDSLHHSDPKTTSRFYIDRTIAGGPAPSSLLPFRILQGDSDNKEST